jgi:hypothetical protein
MGIFETKVGFEKEGDLPRNIKSLGLGIPVS